MKNKEAAFYEKKDNKKIICHLCPHNCSISSGDNGLCRVRINRDGVLYTENYGRLSSLAVDPIEKKPLYHFYPGSGILSLGTYGCNFACDFCQNWRISQKTPRVSNYSPEEIIKIATNKDVKGIAYTYSEPMVWFEYVRDTARLAAKKNLKNVLVTNGFINPKPLRELLPFIDAANVDLKSFSDDFYKKYCRGRLKPVLNNIKLMQKQIHLELTTLIIPDLNDSQQELEKLLGWIRDIDKSIPLHLSRYFPNYKFERSPTPPEVMEEIYQLALEYLDYVYLGNINLEGTADTYCPQCGSSVINRRLYSTSSYIKDGSCPRCGHKIKGIF